MKIMPAFREEIVPSLAVIVIDMQERYLKDLPQREALIDNQLEVLRCAEECHVPVVVVEYYGKGPTIPRLQEALARLSQKKLLRKIIKSDNNAFKGTSLAQTLEELGVQHLLLMGVRACSCVLETARNALSLGFNVIATKTLIAGVCANCSAATVECWYETHVSCESNHAFFKPSSEVPPK